jgi:adenylosuccinate lyase
LRNLGSALGHTILALESTRKGLSKLAVNTDRLGEDLDNAWEVLAEAVQTVMRRYGLPQPYEQLKALTRGKSGITAETLHRFIDGLALPDDARQRLRSLTPARYTGNAESLAEQFLEDNCPKQ